MSNSARNTFRTTRAFLAEKAAAARLAAEQAHSSAADLAALPSAAHDDAGEHIPEHIPELLAAAINQFWALAKKASEDGGFWVSAAGGTANVIAGTFSRRLDVEYERVHSALDQILGEDWYETMAWWQPWPIDSIPYDQEDGWRCKHDAAALAEAAINAALAMRAAELEKSQWRQ